MDDDSNLKRIHTLRLVSIILSLVYCIVWSDITISRYYAMKANVWDLGYVANVINSTVYASWPIQNIITEIANQGILFILTPLAFLHSIPAILVFQSVILGVPVYILFEITLQSTRNPFVSLLISIGYFLYFPLAGVNWSDFQMMDLFVFLLPLGYLLLIKGYLKLGIFVLLLSGFVRFPYMIFVVLSSFSILIEALVSKSKTPDIGFVKERKFVFYLLVLSTGILTLQFLWLSHVNPLLISTHSSTNHSILLNLHSKILAILLLFGPFLFLPLFSKKWVLPTLVLPAAIVLFNNPIYEFPGLFSDWYSVSVIPFLFLGLIDVVGALSSRGKLNSNKIDLSRSLKNKIGILTKKGKGIVIMVVVIIASLAVFAQPYGPFNDKSFNNFNLNLDTQVNMTLFNSANQIISLIPMNESYVLVQNDLPQLFPRTAISNIMVSPYNIGPNITSDQIVQNRFPYSTASVRTTVQINYVLMDFNDIHSLTEPSDQQGFPTMLQIAQTLYNSSFYGILAENNGILLLERGYHGLPEIYHPFRVHMNIENFITNNATIVGGALVLNGSSEGSIQRGPFLSLFPGSYNIAINGNLSGSQNATIYLETGYYHSSNVFIFSNKITTTLKVSSSGAINNLSIELNLNRFVGNGELFLTPIVLSGELVINSISLTQLT